MKKILTLLLAATIAMTMAACNSNSGAASSSAESSTADAAVEDTEDSEEEAPAATGVAELPEIDGFTKGDMAGATTYTAADGSSIAVLSTPADSATLAGFKSKDSSIADQFNQQLASTLGGAEVTGEFKSVEGKDVFAVDMELQGMKYNIYMIAGSDTLYNVTGISMGTDVAGPMGQIVKSL